MGSGAVLAAAGGALWWWTEWLWFAAAGYPQVLGRIVLTRASLFLAGTVLAALVLVGSFALSRRASEPRWAADAGDATLGRTLWLVLPALLTVVAAGFGWSLARLWDKVLPALYAVPAGQADPVLGHDLSCYTLVLPCWSALQRWAMLLVGAAWVGLYLRYVDLPRIGAEDETVDLHAICPLGRAQLCAGGGVLLLVWAWGFWLARFRLLVTARSGVLAGVGYCDAHVRLPLLAALTAVAVLVALVLFLEVRRPSRRRLVGAVVLGVVAFAVALVLPAAYQRLVVAPNEVVLEKPYIARCIEATRVGLGLDRATVRTCAPRAALLPEQLAAQRDVLANIPVWGAHELSEQLVGTEALRTYYSFNLTDCDRYRLGGQTRQVGLMVRELQADRLEDAARTWVNRHLVYTHGLGVVMAAANAALQGGAPVKLISDIPPRTPADLPLGEPRIYYGETPSDYIVTGGHDEFDYPLGDRNVTTRYRGEGGLRLGGRLRRAAWALRLRSVNLLVSRLIGPESRLHLRRSVPERLAALAPFLDLDSDPYPVVADGRVRWVADAYTVSGSYPYGFNYPLYYARAVTQEHPEMFARGSVAYARNSVKAVVDAYDGSVRFHLVDPSCPLARTWERVFPGLLTRDPLPASLAPHVRYPGDLFVLQARAYGRFHMTAPDVFYGGEDQWDIAREETTTRVADEQGRYQFGAAQERMAPYYTLLRLPGEDRPRFRQIVPYTPAGTRAAQTNRDNLIAWLAADCDPESYGALTVFTFPKGRLVYGPLQVEARINQDPLISQQLTLWGQQGSQVLRGRLLVIPLGDSLLYVEPLFITAERRGALPELKRVVVLYNDTVAMAETLLGAFAAALRGQAASGADSSAEAVALRRAVGEAQAALDAADTARAQGDLGAFGEALARARRALAGGR